MLLLLLDIFSIGKIVFVVATMIWIIRDYKAKNYIAIPNQLMIILFFSLSLIHEFVPENLEMLFVYSSFIVGIFACLLISRFYGKRNDKFRYWFYLVFAILQCILILLGVIGFIR